MKGKALLLACVALFSPEIFGQEKLEHFDQVIPGTDLKIEMKAIPGGVFTMGSPSEENGHHEEGPVHKVQVTSFWMSSHEITWALYNPFLQRSIDDIPVENFSKDVVIDIDALSGATIPYVDMGLEMGTGEGMPVVNITYLAALKFCQWLSAKTGNFYRLPT